MSATRTRYSTDLSDSLKDRFWKSGPRLTGNLQWRNFLSRRTAITQIQHAIARKLRVRNYAKQLGNVSQTCRYFAISREIFYQWKHTVECFLCYNSGRLQ